MEFFAVKCSLVLNIIGLLCDIVGAFLVASEVVIQFKGQRFGDTHGVNLGGFVEASAPEETATYRKWEAGKYRKMKIGLSFLVVGFLLQILANVWQLLSL